MYIEYEILINVWFCITFYSVTRSHCQSKQRYGRVTW